MLTGKRPNELTNYETTNLQPPQQPLPAYHQLPADLSVDSIRKEAALVLAQAERHKSKANNGDNIPIFKVKTKRTDSSATPNKFNSLPTRKKKSSGKPVARSVSDATEKKSSKRPSIFNIFSRKSDTNVSQVDRDPRFEDSGGRRLVRSKSDVGSDRKPVKRKLKETKQQPTNSSAKQLPPTPLAPIIEQVQKEDYFEEQFNRERRKSEAITDREKNESGLNELLERSKHQAEVDGSLLTRHQTEADGNLLCRHLAEVDGSLLGRNPISNNIKHKILTLQAKSQENMHSSQLPAQKLPLTKGVTVNGMVKRLSMERFSPPPTIAGTAFSYIRPNEGITYAQLDLSDEQQQQHIHNRREYLRSPTREIRTPVREFRTPIRDIRSTERILIRPGEDFTDFTTSQQQQQHHHSKMNYSNARNSFSPVAGPTTIHISSSHSPSPWQQLSPRNLSDEDEGLGFETRKYFEDEFSSKLRSKSPPEPPIVPVIRSITPPRENSYDRGPGYHNGVGREDLVDDMGYRRARLESRILTRRFGDNTLERKYPHGDSPARNHDEHKTTQHTTSSHQRYLTPENDDVGTRYHKPQTTEILQKYSPERSHLDIISPTSSVLVNTLPKTETKTSRYRHTKYFDDGLGGVKEVYERETRLDENGRPLVRESRHRERVDSLKGKRDHSPTERQHLADYEPKSLDSQFTSTDQYRSSPENMKRYEVGTNGLERGGYQQRMGNEDHWQSSLKRDKLQQRSFDKGDSGIENDFRKESFNGDLTSR